MQHTSPLRKGRWRGDCLYQTLCTIYICSKVNAYFYLLPSLKLTNFLVVKTPMLPPMLAIEASRLLVARKYANLAQLWVMLIFNKLHVFC